MTPSPAPRVLFDVAHPHHVHLFRNLIARIAREGGEFLVATRRKDVTVELCDAYRIPHTVLSESRGRGFLRLSAELVSRTVRLHGLARRFRPDALLGTSVSIGAVGRLLGRPSFVFNEDDRGVAPLFAAAAYPLATAVVTPAALAHERHRKHLTYPGYQELAYLHPNHFTPNPESLRACGLRPDEPYFVLRLVALTSHHDRQTRGLSLEATRALVGLLKAHGRPLITSEAALPEDLAGFRFPLPPDRIHDALAFASAYIGDSQTMAIEAGVLGVPSLRCNTFVGRISVLEELEHRFGLSVGILPSQPERVLETVRGWLAGGAALRGEWRARRERMLAECVDLSEWQWRLLTERVRRHGPPQAA